MKTSGSAISVTNTMREFRVSVHSLPSPRPPTRLVELEGLEFEVLEPASAGLAAPLPVTFDAAAAALLGLPRFYLEGDGSFVWCAARDEPFWRVYGNLYDGGPALHYADLLGTCSPAALDSLIEALGGREAPLMFQLSQAGVFLDEAQFEQYTQHRETRG